MALLLSVMRTEMFESVMSQGCRSPFLSECTSVEKQNSEQLGCTDD
jgi:hypothetical protein